MYISFSSKRDIINTNYLEQVASDCGVYFVYKYIGFPRQIKPLLTSEEINNCDYIIFDTDINNDVFINSAEIFVKNNKYHTVSSWGTDVSYERQNIEGEFVVQCTSPEDVETYQDFYYTTPDTDALSEKVRRTIDLTRQRAIATRCNINGSIKLIISGQYVADLLDFYTTRASASMIYPKYSDFEEGKLIDRAKNMIAILIPLLVSAMQRANDLAMAMDARCYHGGAGRTKMKPLRYNRQDIIAYLIVLVYFALVITIGILV